MPSSSPIVTGELYTADDINALRDDVLIGHTHDGTDGVTIPFSNLGVTGTGGSTRPSGGDVSYDEIEAHIAASQGAHGLPAAIYIAGSSIADAVIIGGTATLSSGTASVSFGYTFKSSPSPVVVACYASGFSNSSSYIDALYVTNITTTGFTVTAGSTSWNSATINWFAFGVAP